MHINFYSVLSLVVSYFVCILFISFSLLPCDLYSGSGTHTRGEIWCFQGKWKDGGRTEVRAEVRGGVAPFAQTRTQTQNVSDVVSKSIVDKPAGKPEVGKSATSRDDLLRQIKELNKALALSEEAVRDSYQHHRRRHPWAPPRSPPPHRQVQGGTWHWKMFTSMFSIFLTILE